MTLDSKFIESKYLLLYDYFDKSKKRFLKVTASAPTVYDVSDLGKDYPNPGGPLYLVFEVSEKAVEPELSYLEWTSYHSIDSLIPADGSPVVVMYTRLFPPSQENSGAPTQA